MDDRITDVERAAIDAWLADNDPTRCPPMTGTPFENIRMIDGWNSPRMDRVRRKSIEDFRAAQLAKIDQISKGNRGKRFDYCNRWAAPVDAIIHD